MMTPNDNEANNLITPAELARELGVSARSIRVYLRGKYGRLEESNETRWRLDDVDADDVRRTFSRF